MSLSAKIADDLRAGMLQREIAAKHGVAQSTVGRAAAMHGLQRRAKPKRPVRSCMDCATPTTARSGRCNDCSKRRRVELTPEDILTEGRWVPGRHGILRWVADDAAARLAAATDEGEQYESEVA